MIIYIYFIFIYTHSLTHLGMYKKRHWTRRPNIGPKQFKDRWLCPEIYRQYATAIPSLPVPILTKVKELVHDIINRFAPPSKLIPHFLVWDTALKEQPKVDLNTIHCRE